MLVVRCALVVSNLEMVVDVGHIQNGTLVVDERDLWYSSEGKVMRVPKVPGGKPTLVTTLRSKPVTAIDAGAAVLFASQDELWSVNKQDGAAASLATGLAQPLGNGNMSGPGALFVDGSDIFIWTGDRLLQLPRAGGVARVLHFERQGLGKPAVDSTSLLYAANTALVRASRKGGVPQAISGVVFPAFMMPEARVMGTEVILKAEKRIFSVPLAGGPSRTLLESKDLRSCASDGTHLYVTTRERFVRLDPRTGESVDLGGHPVTEDARPKFGTVVIDDAFAYTISISSDHARVVRAPRVARGGVLVPAGKALGCAEGELTACKATCNDDDGSGCEQWARALADGLGGESRDVRRSYAIAQQGCAAKRPAAGACQFAALLIFNGIEPLKLDEEKGRALYKRACELAPALACAEYANALRSDAPERPAVLLKACKAGDAKACVR
ncbi:MAG: hypothetical protein Q8O67_21515 [Deltaproteobacteria bacterium]|nr:hypothetical protein [Deltaproteobacteria bacterium]